MSVIEIIYPAKCKHCFNCHTLDRKTYCSKDISEPKTFLKIREGVLIRQNDKACKDLKL